MSEKRPKDDVEPVPFYHGDDEPVNPPDGDRELVK